MRTIDWEKVPKSGESDLPIMTVDMIWEKAELKMTDFQDQYGLAYIENDKFICLTYDQGLTFGEPPISMVDGIIYCRESNHLKSIKNVEMSPDKVYLKLLRL